MERLLLLWDEVDELVGGLHHLTLNLVHDLAGLHQDLRARLGAFVGGGPLPADMALAEVALAEVSLAEVALADPATEPCRPT